MKQTIWIKKEINTEADLPKESDEYTTFCEDELKILNYEYIEDNIPTEDKNYWMDYVEWWFCPIELELPDDTEIENKFPYAVSYANMCSQTGAKWLRDNIKKQLKLNDEWDNLKDFNQPLDKPIEL